MTALTTGSTIRSRGRTITESDLVQFSALTGDWHPQHADAEFAAESRFGERIAHGMLVLSYSVGLIDYELLANDLSGIELAATLLRPFCRTERTRRALLRAYLAACPAELRQAWKENSHDFIFAAAARLALARQDRVGMRPPVAHDVEGQAGI